MTHQEIANMLRKNADLVESGNTCYRVSDTLVAITRWIVQQESQRAQDVARDN